MYDYTAPEIYLEYVIKKEFGWTQEQLEAEPAYIMEYYPYIMNLQAQKQSDGR